ncbi:transcriptional antiterminator BglG [Streptococcus suis]|nr:transcriptional antiterminator BglG [Streptococcus suis]
MRKIIFLDVDGTLVDYHNRIPESAIRAIRQARENGHLVYVCTGRSRAEMQPELWEIGLDGMIGGNGSYVEHQDQVIMHQLLSEEDSRAIVDWLHERGLEFYLESNNGLFASENFRERARETLRIYSMNKGKTAEEVADQEVEDVIHGMIFDGQLYRNDLNNVIQAIDQQGRELIVMGKGLGFQKKAGEELDTSKIEKTFVLQNDYQQSDLSSLYLQMESGEVEVVNAIINRAEETLEVQFDLSLYLALADHLHFVFQRCREGIFIENPLSWEVRKFYPKEYQIGLEALQLVQERLGLELGKGEASSIALHLVNAQKNGAFGKETQTISKIVTQILDIVRLHFGSVTYEEDTSYHRFVTHIQYFAQRVANGVVEGQLSRFLRLYNKNSPAYCGSLPF